jgi:hypothetical protein
LARVVGALDQLHGGLVCHAGDDTLAISQVKNYFEFFTASKAVGRGEPRRAEPRQGRHSGEEIPMSQLPRLEN